MVCVRQDALELTIALQALLQNIQNLSSVRIQQDRKNGAKYREICVYDLKLSSGAQTSQLLLRPDFLRQNAMGDCNFIEVESQALRRQLHLTAYQQLIAWNLLAMIYKQISYALEALLSP